MAYYFKIERGIKSEELVIGKRGDVSESTHSVSKVKEAASVSKKILIKENIILRIFLPNQCQIQEETRIFLLSVLFLEDNQITNLSYDVALSNISTFK